MTRRYRIPYTTSIPSHGFFVVVADSPEHALERVNGFLARKTLRAPYDRIKVPEAVRADLSLGLPIDLTGTP